MDEIEFLEATNRPRPVRRLTIGAIMAVVVPVALILALVRGRELVGGVVAAWGALLLALTESLARRSGRSRARAGAIICLLYPWLAAGIVSFLLAYGSIRPRLIGAEILSSLTLVVLVGVPVALVVNYYLVLAEAYPIGPPGEPRPTASPGVRPLVVASVASWSLGLVVLILVLTA